MEIIAIDDDPIMLHTISMVLEESFGEIGTFEHPDQLTSARLESTPKLLILDLNFAVGDSSGAEGLAWVSRIKAAYPSVSIIILTAHGLLEIAVQALKQGATDFLEKPFSNEKLIATVHAGLNMAETQMRLAERDEEREVLVKQINRFNQMIIGKSPLMNQVMELVEKVANTDASLLITGEHGTGKEILAQLVHQKSERASQPLVTADLGAITPSLFESTLFGHIKGSFTDASEDKLGLMEAANLGTLLLDEIAGIPLQLQSKLLAVLQNRTIQRVGEHRSRAIDVRVISTSHKTIEELNEPTVFRQDLLFRINTVHIELPSLRHRKGDIKELVRHFLDHFNHKYNRSFGLAKAQIKELESYHWPGNIRELKNSIERMVIMDGADQISKQAPSKVNEDNLYEVEKRKIEEIIERHAGNISRASAELGIGRNTLYRKMKKYGI